MFGMLQSHSVQSLPSIENDRIKAAIAIVDDANNVEDDSEIQKIKTSNYTFPFLCWLLIK